MMPNKALSTYHVVGTYRIVEHVSRCGLLRHDLCDLRHGSIVSFPNKNRPDAGKAGW